MADDKQGHEKPGQPILQRERTLAIVLGASEWPSYPDFHAAPSFRRSALDIADYMRSAGGLDLPPRNVKVLVNSFDDGPQILREMWEFIRGRRADLTKLDAPATDLLLYYVGHGGFGDKDEFFLSIRSTNEDDPLATSITAEALGRMIRGAAAGLRTYLMLDCCFAAAATKVFMSAGPLGVAGERLRDALPIQGDALAFQAGRIPQYGTALLCASGPREPARAPPDMPHTMFTGGLLEVLQHGDPAAPAWLSLDDTQRLVRARLEARFAEKAVQPQLHAPQQRMGRLDLVPLFPNPARPTQGISSPEMRNGDHEGSETRVKPPVGRESSTHLNLFTPFSWKSNLKMVIALGVGVILFVPFVLWHAKNAIFKREPPASIILPDDGTLHEATLVYIIGQGSSKCLTAATALEHAPVEQDVCIGDVTQQWAVSDLHGGEIRNHSNGRCIDVPWGSKLDQVPLQLYSCHGAANQLWEYDDQRQLVGQGSRKCIGVPSGLVADRVAVQQFQCTGALNQRWRIQRVHGRPMLPPATTWAIRTADGKHFLTADQGGGLGPGSVPFSGAFSTDSTNAGPRETFEVVIVSGGPDFNSPSTQFALRTTMGNYVTAVNGGGIGAAKGAVSAIHTNASWIKEWETFHIQLNPYNSPPTVTIQTFNGYYLSAVNGGGVGSPSDGASIHSDARAIGASEIFSVVRIP